MRDVDIRGVDDSIASEDQIEVDDARGAWERPRASSLGLDREERLEQFVDGRVGGADADRVQVGRIVLEPEADGLRFDQPRQPEIAEQARNVRRCHPDRFPAIAEVAAERNRHQHVVTGPTIRPSAWR